MTLIMRSTPEKSIAQIEREQEKRKLKPGDNN